MDWDAFLNDQWQNALAFYTTVTAPSDSVTRAPTVVQLQQPRPVQTFVDSVSTGDASSWLLLAAIGAVVLVLVLRK